MTVAARSPVPGSISQAAFEQRLRNAVMDAAPLLNARLLPVSVRSASLNKALAAGLPQLRDDLWRYADLRFLASVPWAPVEAAQDTARWLDAARPLLPEPTPGFARLVFVNGRHAAQLSDDIAALQPDLPPLVPERTRHERFGWLNDAFVTDLARLRVQESQRLEVIFVTTGIDMPQAVHPRLEVTIQPGIELRLIERHVGGAGADSLINAAVQIHAGAGSRCRHLRFQMLALDAQLLDTTQIALDRDASYHLTLLQLGARSARCSLRASLYGAGAALRLDAAAVAREHRTLDHSLLVDHLAPHTGSRQVLRAIAHDRGHIAFRSRVEVAQAAAEAHSDQSLRGLLGGAGAEIDLRPQLEILTDQVRASHGATTGALDENMRFYLLSRGLDADTATALLEWSFLEDAVCDIDETTLRRQAEQALLGRLGSRIAMEAAG